MAEKIQLEVVTPTGPVVSEQVDIVTAPGIDGDFGVGYRWNKMMVDILVMVVELVVRSYTNSVRSSTRS